MSQFERWSRLMASQGGLSVNREGDDVTLTPQLVLEPVDAAVYGDDWVLELQIPTEATWTLSVNDRPAVQCVPREHGKAVHIESKAAIRARVAPGDKVHVVLDAKWLSTRKEERSQRILDGSFVVPQTLSLMGSPGWQLFVPHIQSLLYIGVGNIIDKATEQVHLEILTANLVFI